MGSKMILDTTFTRNLKSIEIQKYHRIETVDDSGIFVRYRIPDEAEPIEFEDTFPAKVGDRIVRKEDGTWTLVRKDHYLRVFSDVDPEMEINVSEDKNQVRAGFRKPNMSFVSLMTVTKRDGEWIIDFIEDLTGYDLISASDILTVFQKVIAQLRELDPAARPK